MKKILFGIVAFALSFSFVTSTDAAVYVKGHYRNGTWVNGYVRSNPNGLKYDNYSYKSGDGLYNKTYGTRGSEWDTPTWITDPDYYTGKSLYDNNKSYSYTNTPSCPLFSSYNSTSGSCECYTGYRPDKDLLGNGTCVSNFSYCTNHYGYGSEYDYLSKQCVCKDDYYFDGTSCSFDLDSIKSPSTNIDWSKYNYLLEEPKKESNASCKEKYTNGATYDSKNDKCICRNTYVWNENGMCEKGQKRCERLFGGKDRTYYNEDDGKCYGCEEGYKLDRDNNLCIPINTNSVVNGNYIVIKDTVKIYRKMNVKSDVLGELKKGEEVNVVKVQNNWAKIKLSNDAFGYVFRNKISSK